MKALILANGEYSKIPRLKPLLGDADLIVCADGGANYAYAMGIKPHFIVGDMDSIRPRVLEFYERRGVNLLTYPRRKNATDLQLALELVLQQGGQELLIAGALGGRLDHFWANLMAGLPLLEQGISICYVSVDLCVYLCSERLLFRGRPGDLVSILPVTERVAGVSLYGMEYPLDQAVLTQRNPYAISNVMLGDTAEILINDGIAAIFHYSAPEEAG